MQKEKDTFAMLKSYQRLADEKRLLELEIEEERNTSVADTVRGSLAVHPYVMRTVKVEGVEAEAAAARGQRNDKRRARIREIEKQLNECREIVAREKDPVLRAALQFRFLQNKSWPDAAEKVYGSRAKADTLRMLVARRYSE